MNEELEQFRLDSIQELKDHKFEIKQILDSFIKEKYKYSVYIHGSILSKKRFTENSDVDIAIYINDNDLKSGPNEILTEKFREKLQKIAFNFGVVDVIVFNKENPKKNQIKLIRKI